MYLLFKRIQLAAVGCSVFPGRFQRNLHCGVVVVTGNITYQGHCTTQCFFNTPLGDRFTDMYGGPKM